MKYLSKILGILGFACCMSACYDNAFDVVGPNQPLKGDMTVNLTFKLQGEPAQTRSKVSGDETAGVFSMQLVCFDANGLYLGIRKAEIPESHPFTGAIKGTVPEGTSRIHFIANRDLTTPLSHTVGTPESVVMNSPELSTLYEVGEGDDTTQPVVCYWGYHKEATADDMGDWLNPTQAYTDEHGPSRVYMIRDRAKVELRYSPAGATVTVNKIEWLIHNGLKRGYLAPKEDSWNNYYQKSEKTDDYISIAGINPYSEEEGRYSLWTSETDNDDDNFDEAYLSSGTITPKAQFLFDDFNTDANPVKVILKVSYAGQTKPIYHVLRLNDDNKDLYPIVRNNTYYIELEKLRPDVSAYPTLYDAINATEYINAPVEVDRSITDITDNVYTLQIKLPTETTSIVFNQLGANTMDFQFLNVSDLSNVTTNPDDFTIEWEGGKPAFASETLSWEYKNNKWVITTTITTVPEVLQDKWIKVVHNGTKLTRFIHVYVIDQFRFMENPTLKAVDGHDGEYVLSFQIPPLEMRKPLDDPTATEEDWRMYPAGLYPIDVKFTTSTLNAYGKTQGTDEYGLFGVSVEPSLDDPYKLQDATYFQDGFNKPLSTFDTNYMDQWYFQQENKPWDFWFTYSIKKYENTADTNNDGKADGVVNIYFKDVRDHIKFADVKNVGLFLYIDYFGKIYSMPVTTTTNP